VRAGDLTDPEFCDRCLEGADHVIHTAAVIDISWTYEQLKPINVDAVRYLYEAARARRLLTFVHFSSGSIYDQEGRLIDERTPLKASSPYEQSKIDSEETLRSFHGRGGPAYVILRPSLIYGPRGRLLGAALAALPPILRLFTGDSVFSFAGGPRLNWVHAEDVARAAIFCMETEQCWGEAFNIADDTPLPIGDVLNAVSDAYGLERGRTVPVPPKWVSRIFYRFIDTDLFFQLINTAAGPLWTMVRSRYGLEDELQVRLDRATASYFIRDVIFSNEKLRKTGFDLIWPDIRTGFPKVLEWYQEQRWAPRIERARDGDVPSTWGFEFRQVLRGTWRPVEGGRACQRVEFAVAARAENVRAFAADNLLQLAGTITMDGLVKDGPTRGTLEAALISRGKFVYHLEFVGDDGKPYSFRGVEDVEPANLLETMTTMEFAVRDAAGNVVGNGKAAFDLRTDLLSMAASFRPIY
jgi:nucleoside-diphosphate-sugar epimerase